MGREFSPKTGCFAPGSQKGQSLVLWGGFDSRRKRRFPVITPNAGALLTGTFFFDTHFPLNYIYALLPDREGSIQRSGAQESFCFNGVS
jgi:hypothetical protein